MCKLQLFPPVDFLKRLKLRTDLDKASATKAERDSVQKPGSSVVTELTAKIKSDFALNARGKILHLLEAVRDHISVSSDIVQGMSF